MSNKPTDTTIFCLLFKNASAINRNQNVKKKRWDAINLKHQPANKEGDQDQDQCNW